MNVLPLPNSLSNLQKCHLPMKYFSEIGNYFNKYVILEIESVRCVVQICFRTDLHKLYCCLDATVCSRPNVSASSLFYKTCDISNITVLDGPLEAKSINISIVFENIEDLVEWKKKANVRAILFNVLKLFGLYSGCHVALKTWNEYFNLDINHITVNSVVLRGKSTSNNLTDTVAKVVNSTNIIIDNETTRNVVQLKGTNEIGVLEKPYKLLTEVVNQNEILKGSGIHLSKNVLLIGPSGCGKKTLVRKVANDCGALLIELKGAEILSPKNGQGRPGEVEENIRRFFGSVRVLCDLLISKEYSRESICSKTNRKSTAQIKNKDAQNVSTTIVFLLLTNLELMCPNRRRSIGSGLVGQITQLLNSIDDFKEMDNLLIFATTSKVDDLDPAVRRPGRLDREVFIGIPTEEERTCILEKLVPVDAAGKNSDISVKVLAKSAASLTPGRVAAELYLLCQQVNRIRIIRKLPSNQDSQSVSKAWLEDYADCAAKLPVSTILHGAGTLLTHEDLSSSHDLRPSLSSIGGLASVKDRLRLSIKEPLVHPEAFKLLGVRPPRGVLLYGPPGCAKTTLARALAMPDSSGDKKSSIEPSITFLSCSAAELYSPYVGESEKKVVELFQRARAGAPSIVFIDELDAIFGSREGMQKGGVQERVLSALLTEMDGVGHKMIAPKANVHDVEGDQLVIGSKEKDRSRGKSSEWTYISNDSFSLVTVIAATNRPDLIDEAVLRPGRLDQLIFIPPPSADGRLEILSYYTSKMPIKGDKESILRNLTDKTHLYSGADLKNLCKEAALCALTEEGFNVQEIEEKHFMKAFNSSRPSLNSEQIVLYENFSRNKYGK